MRCDSAKDRLLQSVPFIARYASGENCLDFMEENHQLRY